MGTRAPVPAVIDLARFRTGTPVERREQAAVLDAAGRSTGLFRVTGHRVPARAEARLSEAVDAFFGLPLWQKKALRPDPIPVQWLRPVCGTCSAAGPSGALPCSSCGYFPNAPHIG